MQNQQGAMIAEEKQEEMPTQVAGSADARKEESETHINNRAETEPVKVAKETESVPKEVEKAQTDRSEAAPAGSGMENAVPLVLNFSDASRMAWPVMGNVLLDYSMDSTVYFPTLDQYKYNPALIIGAETGGQVVAAARGIVESVDVNEETGTTLTLDLGNEYELVYGQLKEVTAEVGEVVETGQLLGYVSEPTKYYCEEGSNLYFEMKKDGVPVDPFLYLDGE